MSLLYYLEEKILIDKRSCIFICDYSEIRTESKVFAKEFESTKKAIINFVRKLFRANKSGRFCFFYKEFRIDIYQIEINSSTYVIFSQCHFTNSLRYQSEAINEFCHDIVEPMRNISNFLQLLNLILLKRGDSLELKYVSFAVNNVNKLKDLTHSVLYDDICESNNKINLSEVLTEINMLISSQYGIERVVVNIEEGIPILSGNKERVFRLFKNLIENAVKYAKTGSLSISIFLEKINTEEKTVNIIFQDNGAALSSEQRNRLNEIVNFGRHTDTLGLLICKKLAVENKGDIVFVESDVGAKYCITLRLH